MTPVPVPRTLDTPPRFLFWDCDVVCFAMTGFAIGLTLRSFLLGVVLGFFAAFFWTRAKQGRGISRAVARLYWQTPFDVFCRLPASARRHFVG